MSQIAVGVAGSAAHSCCPCRWGWAAAGMTPAPPGGPGAVCARPAGMIEADWDAGQAVGALFGAHYQSLVRLAVLLVGDVGTAEEVVQDSFVALHASWRRLRDPGKALFYLRRSVVNRSRSAIRHRAVASRTALQPPPPAPGADQAVIAGLQRSEVVSALRALPARQREALVLRYYYDLTEAQIASAMRISKGAVKSHTARGMAALRAILQAGPG